MKNPGEMTKQEVADETQRFCDALMEAIGKVAEERQQAGQHIHLPCVISALCGVTAHHIAGIPYERRGAVYMEFCTKLLDGVEEALATPGAKALVIDNSKPVQ